MFFENLAFILPSFQQFLLKKMFFSDKMVLIKNETALSNARNYAVTCKGICSYNLVCNFLMQLFPLKGLVFVVHFFNAFWHGKETLPKSSYQNEIVRLLIVFHLSNSKYKSVKISFYSCLISKNMFLLMSHLCRTRVARVSLVSYSCCQCYTRVAFVSLVSGNRVVNQTRSI